MAVKSEVCSHYNSFSDLDNVGLAVRIEGNIYYFSIVLMVEGFRVHLFEGLVRVCCGCGCSLNKGNKSSDLRFCRSCFDADMADLKAEDLAEDSMTDAERLADFLG